MVHTILKYSVRAEYYVLLILCDTYSWSELSDQDVQVEIPFITRSSTCDMDLISNESVLYINFL